MTILTDGLVEQNRLTHKLGNFMTMDESAEIYLQRVKQAAAGIGYGEAQIRDEILSTLPPKCRSAILMSLLETVSSDQIATKAQRFMDLDRDNATGTEVSFSTQDEISQLRDAIKHNNMFLTLQS